MENKWTPETKEKVETKKIQFTSLSEAKKKRGLKLGIYGDFGTGKTHFALTAPEPVYIIDTELGSPQLAHNFEGKDVKVIDVAEKDGSLSYQKILDAVEYITQQEKVGTVILDSATDLWSFCQEFAKVNIFKIKPEARLAQQWDWGVINNLYLKILMKLLRLECNLILTAREAEVYISAGQVSGQVKAKWQKETGFWVDTVLHNTKKIDKLGKTIFTTTIEKCRPNGAVMGKSVIGLDFVGLQKQLEVKE